MSILIKFLSAHQAHRERLRGHSVRHHVRPAPTNNNVTSGAIKINNTGINKNDNDNNQKKGNFYSSLV